MQKPFLQKPCVQHVPSDSSRQVLLFGPPAGIQKLLLLKSVAQQKQMLPRSPDGLTQTLTLQHSPAPHGGSQVHSPPTHAWPGPQALQITPPEPGPVPSPHI